MGTAAVREDDQRAGELDGAADAVGGVLAALGEQVAPVSMAHERTLPVPAELGVLFPEGAMVRGRVLSCVGPAATSVALALMAPAVQAGAGLAVIDVPSIGLDAASELGVDLDRVVGVELGEQPAESWPDLTAAAADGFELVLTRVPAGVRPASARSVVARLQQRGVVVVVLGDPGTLPCDGVLDSSGVTWSGLGDGYGHLRHRSVHVEASGRRLPGARRATVALPGPAAAPDGPDGDVPVGDVSLVARAVDGGGDLVLAG